jgi:mRNA interferase MazF
MRRGEVRWIAFAKPDKRRPVVILTRDSAIEYLGELTVAPITRTIREIPSEVVVGPEHGMPFESAVNLDHVQTVSKPRLGALLTTLPPATMTAIADALSFALGVDP